VGDNFSLAAIPFPLGYESIYRNSDGAILRCPIIAATFQTYDLGMREVEGDCLSIFPKIWDITNDDIDEVNIDMEGYLGIKKPTETLEEFLKKIELDKE
jgi:hypothetical protein